MFVNPPRSPHAGTPVDLQPPSLVAASPAHSSQSPVCSKGMPLSPWIQSRPTQASYFPSPSHRRNPSSLSDRTADTSSSSSSGFSIPPSTTPDSLSSGPAASVTTPSHSPPPDAPMTPVGSRSAGHPSGHGASRSVFSLHRRSSEALYKRSPSLPVNILGSRDIELPSDVNPISPAQLEDLLSESPADFTLIVDIRPYGVYSESRISSAVNICVPTTLLKRPAFHLDRFVECMLPDQQARLDDLPIYSRIVIYDQSSDYPHGGRTPLGRYTSLLYTLYKFRACPMVSASIFYLSGGFDAAVRSLPEVIDSTPISSRKSFMTSTEPTAVSSAPPTSHLTLPPVLTGFSLPTPSTSFSVGKSLSFDRASLYNDDYLSVKVVPGLNLDKLPSWLIPIARDGNTRIVTDRFMELENREKQRLTSVFSRERAFKTPADHDSCGNFQYSMAAGVRFGYKNRYNNIWPYDHTRVLLPTDLRDGETSCDYINASHICASKFSIRRYIATQAPLPETVQDFWKVVWDHEVPVIVMLTAESEGGQLKSHPYWQNDQFGSLKLTMTSEESRSLGSGSHTSVILRRFDLCDVSTGSHHNVVQMHYTDWPDLGRPASAEDLLALSALKNTLVQEWWKEHPDFPRNKLRQEPISLVHCSAGCGRTGTFCTVDTVLHIMDQYPDIQESDLVFKVVDDFRRQRQSMVQSLRQYSLCYESILLWCSQEQRSGGGEKP